MNQVDEETLCECATSKSIFIYLFIYLFIYILHTFHWNMSWTLKTKQNWSTKTKNEHGDKFMTYN